jgi:TolB-like protein
MADPADAQARPVRFGPFELDCRAGELRKHGIRIKLREQPILILGMLLDRPGQVVLREEIRLRLWSTDTIVEFDHGINSAIQKLRNALGDSAADPRYVETVARRGYRFLRKVEKVGDDSAEPVDQHPSIAVLPFANMSADQENEYFCDGLAEEILNLLAKIPGLKVIARTSAFTFRGQEQDIRKIAETLGVRNVLEGSVRRAGDRVRIAVQLVNAVDGAYLWAERYDRDLTDIFAIQNEIGQAISEALNLRLAPRAQTVNIEAYQNFLKGQFYRQRLTPKTAARAKECFGRALAIDPNYAAAHSGLASYYHSLAVLTTERSGDIAPLAKSAAEKALAIDPANSEAHSILATVAGIVDYEWRT